MSWSFPKPSMRRLCIYLHEWLIFTVNVGKYPMDGMGFMYLGKSLESYTQTAPLDLVLFLIVTH